MVPNSPGHYQTLLKVWSDFRSKGKEIEKHGDDMNYIPHGQSELAAKHQPAHHGRWMMCGQETFCIGERFKYRQFEPPTVRQVGQLYHLFSCIMK